MVGRQVALRHASQPIHGNSGESRDMVRSHYAVLTINSDATSTQIKQAYRKRLLEIHPDKATSGANTRDVNLDELKKAYETLSSTSRRREYDALLARPPIPSHPIKSTPRPAQVISLDQFQEFDGPLGTYWTYACRCSSSYVLREEDLEKDIHLVSCDGCSESIYAGYELEA